MMTSIKHIHVINGLDRGGAEMLLRDYSVFCVNNDISLDIINLNKKANSLVDEFPEGVVANHSDMKKHSTIVCHMFPALIKVLIKNYFFGILFKRLYFHQHNEVVTQKARQLILFILRPFRTADILFSSSHRKWYNTKKVYVLKNFVQSFCSDSWSSICADNKKIKYVFVGRLVFQKNIEKLLNTKLYDNEELHIFGDGPDRNKVVDASKRSSSIIYHGVSTNLRKFLWSFDALILTSRHEGFPIVCLEAAVSGLPLITTQVGSIREDFASIHVPYEDFFDLDCDKRSVILENKKKRAIELTESYSANFSAESFHLNLVRILNVS